MRNFIPKRALLLSGIAVVSLLVVLILAQTNKQSTNKPAIAPPQSAPAVSQLDTHQRGGPRGASTQSTGLPSDLPTEIPLPDGSLTAGSGSSPRWALLYNIPNSFEATVKAARLLYTSHGYTDLQPNSTTYSFENSNYFIRLAPESSDHSATNTNLTVQIQRR